MSCCLNCRACPAPLPVCSALFAPAAVVGSNALYCTLGPITGTSPRTRIRQVWRRNLPFKHREHRLAAIIANSCTATPMAQAAAEAACLPTHGRDIVPSSGQTCIDTFEQLVPTLSGHWKLLAIVVWVGWRGFVAVSKSCRMFRHWIAWRCLRCSSNYMLRSRKWYTGLPTWQYSDKVIATSLC